MLGLHCSDDYVSVYSFQDIVRRKLTQIVFDKPNQPLLWYEDLGFDERLESDASQHLLLSAV